MLLERAEHPEWTSNAYLVADGDGGHGVLVDSNGVEEPLLAADRARGITITHVLVTHQHGDHVVDVAGLAQRFGVKVVGSALTKRRGRADRRDVRRRRRRPLGRARDPGDRDARPLPRPLRAARERHRLPDRRLPLQGNGRRHDGRRPDRLRRPGELDHEPADDAAARDAHPSRAHAALDGRRRVGATTRSSASGAASTPREPSSAACAARRRR